MNYEKMQIERVKEINVWTEDSETTVCLGKIRLSFFIKAIKTWLFNTCLEIKGATGKNIKH